MAEQSTQSSSIKLETVQDYENRRTIEAFAQEYHLALPERHSGARMGEQQGRATGSSIEFQDRKDYVPGDDLRHIDWRAYARNDRLTIKLFREEITPIVDIVIDTSASMVAENSKMLRRLDMAYFFSLLGRKLNAQVRIWALGRELIKLNDVFDLIGRGDDQLEDPIPLLRSSPVARKGGIKVFISDFLFPHDPRTLVGTFTAADALFCVQVLSAFEDHPPEGGAVRLQDAETNEYLDLALDGPTVKGYRERLDRLREDLDNQLRVQGGALACLHDELDFESCIKRMFESRMIDV